MPGPTSDPFPPFATDRLRLRCVESGDAKATAALMTAAISATVASWPPSLSQEMALGRIKSARTAATAGRAMPCAIVRQRDAAFLGWAGINRLADDDTRGELGYWIGEPFQGQGYATEAAGGLISAAFNPAFPR